MDISNSSRPRPEPEPNKNITAHRIISVIRLDRRRKRVSREICPDASLYKPEQIDVARIADRIRADAERTAIPNIELLFDTRLIREQLIFGNQFGAAGNEIPAANWKNRFDQV